VYFCNYVLIDIISELYNHGFLILIQLLCTNFICLIYADELPVLAHIWLSPVCWGRETGIIRKEFEWQQLVCNKVVHLTDVSEKNVP
jgi:hypothetical protein